MRENLKRLIGTLTHWIRAHACGLLIASLMLLLFISRFQLGITRDRLLKRALFKNRLPDAGGKERRALISIDQNQRFLSLITI